MPQNNVATPYDVTLNQMVGEATMGPGGGMPPGVTTENINAFIEAVKNYKN